MLASAAGWSPWPRWKPTVLHSSSFCDVSLKGSSTKFAFLRGGDGSEYYKWRLQVETDKLQPARPSAKLPGPPALDAAARSELLGEERLPPGAAPPVKIPTPPTRSTGVTSKVAEGDRQMLRSALGSKFASGQQQDMQVRLLLDACLRRCLHTAELLYLTDRQYLPRTCCRAPPHCPLVLPLPSQPALPQPGLFRYGITLSGPRFCHTVAGSESALADVWFRCCSTLLHFKGDWQRPGSVCGVERYGWWDLRGRTGEGQHNHQVQRGVVA